MPFLVKDIIFDLFGHRDKRNDSFKDSNNKGIIERFNEIIGEDIDTDLLPKVTDIIDNTLVPQTVFDKFVPLLEALLGQPVNIGSDLALRRKMLNFILRFYQIKGTERSYQILLGILGFQVDIVEFFKEFGFDSDVTFDDEPRVFDSSCPGCSDYAVYLTGVLTITPELLDAIYNILEFNEPINANLISVTYNCNFLVQEIIGIFVDTNGDLIYNNEFDPGLILTLDNNGDLIISGPNASKYSVDVNGDLIYTIGVDAADLGTSCWDIEGTFIVQ